MKYPPGVSLKNPGGALKYLLRFPAKMKNAKEKKRSSMRDDGAGGEAWLDVIP
jgi:hypothetical protein